MDIKPLKLNLITNKNYQFWPEILGDENLYSDDWRLRFVHEENNHIIKYDQIISIISKLNEENIEIIRTENLYLANSP